MSVPADIPRGRSNDITSVRVRVVSVPMDSQIVAWSTTRLASRDLEYVFAWVETADGQEGFGFTVGSAFQNSGRFIAAAVNDLLAPILVGRDASEIEALWEEMAFQTLLLGRRGAVMRAISIVDIALWDLLAKSVGKPLCDLLGRYRSRVPAYASGGYYYSDDYDTDVTILEAEVRRHVELGFRAVKIKIGRLSPERDHARILRVMEAVGPDVRVAVDANNAWRDAISAVNALRRLDDLGLWWIEEPVFPDQMPASAEIAKALATPVATGEIEAGRWAFQQLVDLGAADILQPDVTVIGGISEWRKVAHMAACRDIPVAPHWAPDIHVHLGAATTNLLAVEYFHAAVGALNFDKLLAEPLRFEDGDLIVPDRPGHGVLLDPEAVDHYEIT